MYRNEKKYFWKSHLGQYFRYEHAASNIHNIVWRDTRPTFQTPYMAAIIVIVVFCHARSFALQVCLWCMRYFVTQWNVRRQYLLDNDVKTIQESQQGAVPVCFRFSLLMVFCIECRAHERTENIEAQVDTPNPPAIWSQVTPNRIHCQQDDSCGSFCFIPKSTGTRGETKPRKDDQKKIATHTRAHTKHSENISVKDASWDPSNDIRK